MKQLKKSDKKILTGVCGGIAQYFNIDPTVVRLVLCVVTVLNVWLGIIFYVAASILMPSASGSFEDTFTDAEFKENNTSSTGSDDSKAEENGSETQFSTEKNNQNSSENSTKNAENKTPHTDEEFNQYFKNLGKKNK